MQYFSSDPVFNKKLTVVNHRSDMEKFPYGIIFRNISGNKNQLGMNDYLGVVNSYVSFAKVGNNPGSFLNLVSEDIHNIFYVAEEDLSPLCNGSTLKFPLTHIPHMQDALTGDILPCTEPMNIQVILDGTRVNVSKVEPLEKTIYLPFSPLPNSKLSVKYSMRHLINQGYYFLEVTSVFPDKSAEVYVGHYESIEKQPISFKSNYVKIFVRQSVLATKQVRIFVDGLQLNSGFYFNKVNGIIEFRNRPEGHIIELRDQNDNVLQTNVDWRIIKFNSTTLIQNALGNEITCPFNISDKYEYFLFLNGKKLIPRTSSSARGAYDFYIKKGVIYFLKPLPKGSTLTVDYSYFETTVSSYATISELFDSSSTYKLPDDYNLLKDFFEVYENDSLLLSNEYTVDYTTNTVIFNKIPRISAKYTIAYRLDLGTKGPYIVQPHSDRNDILPGCILHFSNSFQENDKVVVLVGDQRKTCADEYGGKWQFNVELVTVCPDPISSEDLTDKLGFYIASILKPNFDALGMYISPEVQIGGDSNEEKDDATNDVDFQNTVSFSVMSDWYMRIPRKFRILSVTSQVQSLTPLVQTESLSDYLYYPKYVDGLTYMMYSTERI